MSEGIHKSRAAQAYDEIEHRLVTLELAPGQLLQEQELADSLGFGRTPVREALQRLAAQGLLRIYPRKGIQVEPLEAPAMARVLEARRVLERLLVVKAAERADNGQRQVLRELADQFEAAEGDPAGFFRLDRALDEALSDACDNPYLVQALLPLRVHCRRLWFRFQGAPEAGEAARLHASLARAVADDPGAGAITALNGIIAILDIFQGRLAASS